MHSTGTHFYTILESYAILLQNMFEIVTISLSNFWSLLEGKFNLEKRQIKVILLLPATAIYEIAIILLILMLVNITKDDSSTKTVAYADNW